MKIYKLIKIAEIVLVSLFLISICLPYDYDVIPIIYGFGLFWYLLSDSVLTILLTGMFIGIPLLMSVPLLVISIRQNIIKAKSIKYMFYIFISLYVCFLGGYIASLINGILNDNPEKLDFIISIIFSLIPFIITLTISKKKILQIKNTLISIITLPVMYHMFSKDGLDFGLQFFGYILYFSFIGMYIIGFANIFIEKKYSNKNV